MNAPPPDPANIQLPPPANENGRGTAGPPQLAKPTYRRTRIPFPLIWLLPLLAAAGASVYYGRYLALQGPEVTVTVGDGTGIRTGETPVTVHGVRVGTVEQVDLSSDEKHAILHVRFYRSTIGLARDQTQFWLVRPELAGGNINGLSTIIAGPYLEALPGPGQPRRDFEGLDSPPVMSGDGVRVVLHAKELGRLELDSPVYYRGIQVGNVQDIRLSNDATDVNATLFIWAQYQRLLRSGSEFWADKSTEVSGGLFSGVHVALGSLRSALGGGVIFATPDDPRSAPARDGDEYYLNDEAKKEWLAWSPRIFWDGVLPPDAPPGNDIREQQGGLRSTMRVR